jgi:hypothetical protein
MKIKKITILLAFFTIGAATPTISQNPAPQTEHQVNHILYKGLIKEQETNSPLAYVNIGLMNKPVGTVSDTSGAFSLPLLQEHLSDTIRLSLVGYAPKKVLVNDFIQSPGKTIYLTKTALQLDEVVVSGVRLRTDVLGMQKEGGFIQFSLQPKEKIVLGSEIGLKIKAGKSPASLKDFNWYLGANNFQHIKFRVNIYSLKGNLPDALILNKEIYADVSDKKTGWNRIDLEPLNITVQGDFVISLQWIDHSFNAAESPKVFVPGTLSPFQVSYFRVASQDKWKKVNANLNYYVTLLH